MPRKITIEDMQKLAEAKGGKCLSEKYVNSKTKLDWKCGKGHIWKTLPKDVKRGHWCPHCVGLAKLTIEEMQRRARKKGGNCLSEEYINSTTKLKWQCEKGHVWEAKPCDVNGGKWCPKCWAERRGLSLRKPMEEIQKLAEDKGGKCLSTTYLDNKTKLKWQCKEGHVWEAKTNDITQGRWCPVCSQGVSERICRRTFEELFGEKFPKKKPKWLVNSRGNGMELDGYCAKLGIALEYQGKQHYFPSTRFVNVELLKQRQEDDKQKRRLCKEHSVILIEVPYTIDYHEMSDWIANECAKQGVSVPEKEGVDYRTFDVYSPQKLKEMQEIARSRGGRCLSPRYIHKETKMQWECGKGHTWWARAGGVKMGQWCPKCGSKKSADTRRSNIEEMQKVAEARGGKCLSSVYVNNLTKLEWICSKGHRWFATPINVKNSHHWCPYCSNRSPYRIRLTLVDMQKTAEERGGRCLSTKYVNNRIKLRWQCDKGHVWETKPANVRSGTWCPFCAGKRHS